VNIPAVFIFRRVFFKTVLASISMFFTEAGAATKRKLVFRAGMFARLLRTCRVFRRFPKMIGGFPSGSRMREIP